MHESKCDPEEEMYYSTDMCCTRLKVKSDPEEEMYYSTDYVLHKTKSVTIIYIRISAVYVITLL